ncbi:glycosyltransferase family 2 protein [Pseudalkalibacillus hwajinpoensis]|uniref:glycosyltransferase family 2 protein n=1 Tax=Guptibacillus hwajinpoensis TaxID=208199 RepID=UPI00325ADABD
MNVSDNRVSVIIPTYKREVKYLSRAIDSIKKQTYIDTEVVVVDDNSPNSSYRKEVMLFMQQYKNDSKVIFVVNAENLGGSLARNNGINAATGQYITFLDDDDEYLPKKIEKQLKFMIDNECDMSFTDLKLVNEKKVVIDYREYTNLKHFDNQNLLKFHILRHLTGTPTFMYKVGKLKEIGGFEDAKVGQEFYLMLKSIEANLKIRYLNQCDVIAYRHNNGGISYGINKIIGEKTLYKFKQNYFYLFNKRELKFLRFRHNAVMLIATKRNKNYFYSLLYAWRMIVSSPVDFIIEIREFTRKILVNRKIGE